MITRTIEAPASAHEMVSTSTACGRRDSSVSGSSALALRTNQCAMLIEHSIRSQLFRAIRVQSILSLNVYCMYSLLLAVGSEVADTSILTYREVVTYRAELYCTDWIVKCLNIRSGGRECSDLLLAVASGPARIAHALIPVLLEAVRALYSAALRVVVQLCACSEHVRVS